MQFGGASQENPRAVWWILLIPLVITYSLPGIRSGWSVENFLKRVLRLNPKNLQTSAAVLSEFW